MDIIIVKGEKLNWDEFQEWFKKRYGWSPDREVAIALKLYLQEKIRELKDNG